jgi:hypothetical protein
MAPATNLVLPQPVWLECFCSPAGWQPERQRGARACTQRQTAPGSGRGIAGRTDKGIFSRRSVAYELDLSQGIDFAIYLGGMFERNTTVALARETASAAEANAVSRFNLTAMVDPSHREATLLVSRADGTAFNIKSGYSRHVSQLGSLKKQNIDVSNPSNLCMNLCWACFHVCSCPHQPVSFVSALREMI